MEVEDFRQESPGVVWTWERSEWRPVPVTVDLSSAEEVQRERVKTLHRSQQHRLTERGKQGLFNQQGVGYPEGRVDPRSSLRGRREDKSAETEFLSVRGREVYSPAGGLSGGGRGDGWM